MHIYIYIYLYIYIYINIYIYIYSVYIYIYVCVCAYLNTYDYVYDAYVYTYIWAICNLDDFVLHFCHGPWPSPLAPSGLSRCLRSLLRWTPGTCDSLAKLVPARSNLPSRWRAVMWTGDLLDIFMGLYLMCINHCKPTKYWYGEFTKNDLTKELGYFKWVNLLHDLAREMQLMPFP